MKMMRIAGFKSKNNEDDDRGRQEWTRWGECDDDEDDDDNNGREDDGEEEGGKDDDDGEDGGDVDEDGKCIHTMNHRLFSFCIREHI